MSPFVTLLMDLVLLRTNEGAFVDIWVDFDVRVIRELKGVPPELIS